MNARKTLSPIIDEARQRTPSWIMRATKDETPTVLKALRAAGGNPRAVYRDRSGQKRYYKTPMGSAAHPNAMFTSGHSLKKHATHADIYHRGGLRRKFSQEPALEPLGPISWRQNMPSTGTVMSPLHKDVLRREAADLEAWHLGQQNDREMRKAGSKFV